MSNKLIQEKNYKGTITVIYNSRKYRNDYTLYVRDNLSLNYTVKYNVSEYNKSESIINITQDKQHTVGSKLVNLDF
jgi:hypothetical protein